MDYLDKNLNDVRVGLEQKVSDHYLGNEKFLQVNRFRKRLKIVQKKIRFEHFYIDANIMQAILFQGTKMGGYAKSLS